MKGYQQIKEQLSGEKGHHIQVWLLTLLFLSQLLPQRFSYILTAVWVLPWLLQGGPMKVKTAFQKYPILWLLMSLFLIQVVGLLYTEDLKAGRLYLEQRLSFVLIPIIVFSSGAISSKKLYRIFDWFSYAWLIAAILSLVLALKHNQEVIGELNGKSYWLMAHHNLVRPIGFTATMAALYVGFCMLWLFYKLLNNWSTSSNKSRLSMLLLLTFFMGYQVLLSSRTIHVTVVLLIYGGTLIYLFRRGKKLIAVGSSIFIPLLFLGMLYSHDVAWARFTDAFKFGEKMENTQFGGHQLRLEIWGSAWEVIRGNPILGVGTGDIWPAIIAQHEKRGFTEGVEKRFHAHNQYLQDWIGLGILGLGILLMNLLIPIWLSLKSKHYLYLAFLILIAFSCITDTTISFYRGIFFFALTNTLLLHQTIQKN